MQIGAKRVQTSVFSAEACTFTGALQTFCCDSKTETSPRVDRADATGISVWQSVSYSQAEGSFHGNDLRQIPVVERYPGFDACCQQAVDD